MSVKKYLTLNGLTYFFNKIKTYLTSSTYLNSIGISNSDIDDIADDAGYSSGSLPASEDIFITGDIIPNTDNSVDLGASSKNIKMIYTKGITINGTVCGDILTHNASEFVNVTTAQTIGGVKTFTSRLTYKATNTIAGDGTSGNFAGSFNFIDKNNVQLGTLGLSVFNNNGYTEQTLSITNPLWFNDNTKLQNFAVRFRVMHETEEVSFTPSRNNTINLGSTTYKWKTLNGLNPGALSLPSSTYINVDTTNWDVAGGTNVYTPPANGWLHIRVVGATELMVRWTGWRFGDRRVSATATDLGVTIPVVAGVTVDVVTVASGFDGKCQFFPCQGNV